MDIEEIIRAEYAACGVYEDLDSSTDGDETFGFKESKLSPTRKTASLSQNSLTKSRKVSQFRDLRGHSDDFCVIERESRGSLPCVEAIIEGQDLRARSNSITESIEDDPYIDGASDNETEISEDGVTPPCFTTVDEEVEEDDVVKEVGEYHVVKEVEEDGVVKEVEEDGVVEEVEEDGVVEEVGEDDVVRAVHQIDGIHPGELSSDKRNSHPAAELHHDRGVEYPHSLNASNDSGREGEEADESEYHGEVYEGAYDSEEFECDGNGDDQEMTVRCHVTEYGEGRTLIKEDVSNHTKDSVGVLEGLVACESDVTTQNKKEVEGKFCEASGHNVEEHSFHLKVVSPIDPQETSSPPVNMRGASNRIRHKSNVESSVRWNGNTEERCNSVSERRKNIPSNTLPSIPLGGSGSGRRVDSFMRASNVSLYDLALNGSPDHTERDNISYIVTYPCPHPQPQPHPQPPSADNTHTRTETTTLSINKVEETPNNRSIAQQKNVLNRNVLKAKKQGYVSRLQQQSNKEAAVRLLKGRVDAAMMKKRTNMRKCVRDRDVHEATFNNQALYGYERSGYNSDYIKSNYNNNDCKDIHRDCMGVPSNTGDSNEGSNKGNTDKCRDRSRERSRDRDSDRGIESTRSNIQDNNKRYYDTSTRSAPTLPRAPVRTVMPAIRALGRLSLSPVRQRKGGVAVGETHKHHTLFKRCVLPLDDYRLQDFSDRMRGHESDAGSTPRSSCLGPKKKKDDTSQKSKLEIANQNFNSYYGASGVDESGFYGRDGREGRGEGEAGGGERERTGKGEGDGRQFMDYPLECSQHYSINTTRQCSATSTRRGQGQGEGENNYSGRNNDSGSDGKINFSGCNIEGSYDECGYSRSDGSSAAASSHRYDEGKGDVAEEEQDEAVKAIGGRQGVRGKVRGKGSSIAWSSAAASITTSSPSSPSCVRALSTNDIMVENKRNQQSLPHFKSHAPRSLSPTARPSLHTGTSTGTHTGTCLPAMLKERRRRSLTSHSTILHPRQPTKPTTSHTTSPFISHRPSLPASRTTHTTLPTLCARKSVSEKSYSKPQKLLTRLHSSNSDHDYGSNNDNNNNNYNDNNNSNNGSCSNNNNDNNNQNRSNMNDTKNSNMNGHKMSYFLRTQGEGFSDATVSNVLNAQKIEKNRQFCSSKRLPTSTVKITNMKTGKNRETSDPSKVEKRFPNIINVSEINRSNNGKDREKLLDAIDMKDRDVERESEREKERGRGTETTHKKMINSSMSKDMNMVSMNSNNRGGNKEEDEEEGEGHASKSLYLDEWFLANPLKPSNAHNNNDNSNLIMNNNNIKNNNSNNNYYNRNNNNNSNNNDDNYNSSSGAMMRADLLDNNGSYKEQVHTYGLGAGLEKERNPGQMRRNDTVEKLEKIVLARFGFVTDENDEICVRRTDDEVEGDKSNYDDDGYDSNYDHNNYDDDIEDDNEGVPDEEVYERM